jgi:hypothetical protein
MKMNDAVLKEASGNNSNLFLPEIRKGFIFLHRKLTKAFQYSKQKNGEN